MPELTLLRQSEAKCYWQACLMAIHRFDSLAVLRDAVAPIAARIDAGAIRMFAATDGVVCVSVREAVGLDALFIDYVQISRVSCLREYLPALLALARSAGFVRVACCPVTDSRSRLYQRLGFMPSGEYLVLEVE